MMRTLNRRQFMVMSGIMAFVLVLMLSGCDKTVAPKLDNPYDSESASYVAFPELTTRVVTQVSTTQAESGGSFGTDYGSEVSAKGVCWLEQGAATGLPVVGGNCTDEGGGFDSFVSVMTGLEPGVSYVVRSYATNADGTVYGGEQAFETLAVYGLSVAVDGSGSVTPESGEYEEGTQVELTATSDFGWVFARWEGVVAEGGSTDNPVTVLMDSDKSLTAVFERLDYSLEVLIEGEGTVEQQVVSLPTSDYAYETQVELTAQASFGWVFARWEGDVAEGGITDNLVTVLIDGDKSVTAVFERADYSLEVLIEGEGTVEQQVVSQPTSDYPYEAQVELTAQASDGWRFLKWTGDVAGGGSTDNPVTVLMDGDKNVTAVFEQIPFYTLTTNVEGSGTVMPFFGEYEEGTQVELTATSEFGWVFSRWEGDLPIGTESTDNPLVVTMDSDKSVTAVFEEELWIRDTETVVLDVVNPTTGVTWMDRNLGASRVAISLTDSEAYGDLYQWGRAADGHQKRTSGTTNTLSPADQPDHGDFITTSIFPFDWRNPQNDNLWQGVNGVNNPCPVGYRLPTESEWTAERGSWGLNSSAGAYFSPLKLTVTGVRYYNDSSLGDVGSNGFYWSSSVDGTRTRLLGFGSGSALISSDRRAYGLSVRCLKD